jgi:hypothetical protein
MDLALLRELTLALTAAIYDEDAAADGDDEAAEFFAELARWSSRCHSGGLAVPQEDRSAGTFRSASDRLTGIGDGLTHVGDTRASADLLEQGHDNPFRPTHVGHPHAVLVLADAADEPVPVRSQLIDDRFEVTDLE